MCSTQIYHEVGHITYLIKIIHSPHLVDVKNRGNIIFGGIKNGKEENHGTRRERVYS